MVQLGVQMDTDISNPIRMCTRIGCGYQYEFSLPNHMCDLKMHMEMINIILDPYSK